MKQLLLPIPILALALSGCVSDPQAYALEKSTGDKDYRARSDSAMALLESMAEPQLVYKTQVKTQTLTKTLTKVEVQKELVYVTSDPIVSAMVRPEPPSVIRDTVRVYVEKVEMVEKVSAAPKRRWSWFRKSVDTVYMHDTVYLK